MPEYHYIILPWSLCHSVSWLVSPLALGYHVCFLYSVFYQFRKLTTLLLWSGLSRPQNVNNQTHLKKRSKEISEYNVVIAVRPPPCKRPPNRFWQFCGFLRSSACNRPSRKIFAWWVWPHVHCSCEHSDEFQAPLHPAARFAHTGCSVVSRVLRLQYEIPILQAIVRTLRSPGNETSGRFVL